MAKKMKTTEQVLRDQEAQAEMALAQTKTSVPATNGGNPWIEFGSALDAFLGAPFLRFTKQGEFAISDVENIPDGTRCIAHADEIQFGWVRWEGGKRTDRRMGRVADRFAPANREDLGDIDQQKWEAQDDGTRRDPWQRQAEVPITRIDTGETYLFSTGSKGGIGCVARLTRMYGGGIQSGKAHGRLPVVELKAESYRHKTYGKIFTPAMHVTGWADGSGRPLSLAEELDDEIPAFK